MNEFGNRIHIYYTMLISFLSVLLNCFMNLYLTPQITNSVGAEAYGFVSLAKNFVMYANVIMTALNSYAARYMTVSYMQKKEDEFKKYFNTVFWGDCLIGGLLFLVGLGCTMYLELILDIPPSLSVDVKTMFVLTFLTFYITTASTVFMAVGYVKDRLDLVNSIKAISYIVEIAILCFAYLLLKPKVWYVGFATFLAAAIMFVGTIRITNRFLPGNKLSILLFDKVSFKTLVVNGLWNSTNSLGNALNSGLDLLVSNVMLNALSMGQVSIAKTISNMIYTLYATISQPFHPTFLKCYSSGNTKELLKELKYSMKICGIITNLIFAGFIILGMDFYSLWIPTQDIALIYKLTVIAMLPCITEGCLYPIYYIYTLTVKNKVPCLITVAGGVLNVAGMIILLKFTNLGVFAIVLTTAVVMNFVNLVTNPLYMSKCLKLKYTTFYPEIFRNILSCGCTILMMKTTLLLFSAENNWTNFVVRGMLCVVAGTLIQLFIAFKPAEIQQLVFHIIRKVKKR